MSFQELIEWVLHADLYSQCRPWCTDCQNFVTWETAMKSWVMVYRKCWTVLKFVPIIDPSKNPEMKTWQTQKYSACLLMTLALKWSFNQLRTIWTVWVEAPSCWNYCLPLWCTPTDLLRAFQNVKRCLDLGTHQLLDSLGFGPLA